MWTIALNTFREIIRNKYFSLVFLFGIILFVGIFFLNILSLNQTQFIVFDFGLSFIEITGIFIILFLGNRILSKEFEEKTIYLTLSRPISRSKIILGKFLGFAFILVLAIFLQLLFLISLALFLKAPLSSIIFLAIFGILMKHLIILSLIILFSIFLSSGVATFLTLSVYIIAHSGYALVEYAKQNNNQLIGLVGDGILFFFPNFQALNIKNLIHGNEINLSQIAIIFLFAFLYLITILILSQWGFIRKKFDNI